MPFLPTASRRTDLPASRSVRSSSIARRMTLALNEPARPRSPVMTTRATVRSSSCSRSRAYCSVSSEYVARSIIISTMPIAYGRSASMRPCARRSLAAATISMALVILRVFWTDAIRRRMSRSVATSG